MNATAAHIATALHGVDPYEGFPYAEYPPDLQGWSSRSAVFVELIEELRPGLIVEVGTWKGASATFMCEIMARNGIPGAVVCVDTWLGGEWFWQNTDQRPLDQVRRFSRFGRPVDLYHQFLANVMHLGYRDRIVPFPNPSGNAARWLQREGIVADMVCIDASHDERDVYFDLVDYWALLRARGVACGDDWSSAFPGVERAVTRFAGEVGCAIEHRDEAKWFIRKPA